MKKSFLVFALAGLLSLPSVVLAEASWYGSIRAGWQNDETQGLANYGSRWGIKGSSEVSDGLAAVYQFEDSIDVTNANATHPAGRLSYVGLSGGFGTITLGHIWKAGYNHFGGIVESLFGTAMLKHLAA